MAQRGLVDAGQVARSADVVSPAPKSRRREGEASRTWGAPVGWSGRRGGLWVAVPTPPWPRVHVGLSPAGVTVPPGTGPSATTAMPDITQAGSTDTGTATTTRPGAGAIATGERQDGVTASDSAGAWRLGASGRLSTTSGTCRTPTPTTRRPWPESTTTPSR